MRVLLIEDYLPLVKSIGQGLREAGYAVDSATDGQKGLECAEAGEHDYGEVRINFADLAQTVDAVHPGHTNVHDNCIGAFFL